MYVYIVNFPSSLRSLMKYSTTMIKVHPKHFGSGKPLGVGSGGISCLKPFGKARQPSFSGQGPFSFVISRSWPSRADW